MAPLSVSWEEVCVSLGWGCLRGKTCVLGAPPDSGYRRVLVLHGWLDNANTFDTLIPLLPEGLQILALDLAGHGFSDHLPVGSRYDAMTHLVYVHEAVRRLGWSDFIFLTHSLGSFIANYYTAMYPNEVRALIMLDHIVPLYTRERIEMWRADSSLMLREERGEGRPRRVFSEDEALSRMVEARKVGNSKDIINEDIKVAKVLFSRAARRVADGYVWRHDEKARTAYISLYGFDNWLYVISHITCPVLLIRAARGVYQQSDEVYAPVLEAYKKSARIFRYHIVSGPHLIHLTHPHRVAPIVTDFLNVDVELDNVRSKL